MLRFVVSQFDEAFCVVAGVQLPRLVVGDDTMTGHVWDLTKKDVGATVYERVLGVILAWNGIEIESHQT